MPREPHLFQTLRGAILMAEYKADRAVKQQLRDQGIKVHYVAMSQIKFQRRRRARLALSNIRNDAQRQGACETSTIPVPQSGAK